MHYSFWQTRRACMWCPNPCNFPCHIFISPVVFWSLSAIPISVFDFIPHLFFLICIFFLHYFLVTLYMATDHVRFVNVIETCLQRLATNDCNFLVHSRHQLLPDMCFLVVCKINSSTWGFFEDMFSQRSHHSNNTSTQGLFVYISDLTRPGMDSHLT